MFGNKEQQQFVALQERTTQVRSFIAHHEKGQPSAVEESSALIDSVNRILKLKPEHKINPPDLVDVVLNEASQSFDEYAALVANRADLKARKIKIHEGQQQAYEARMADLAAKVEGAWRVTEAIKLGYDPYSVPNTFYAGTLSRKEAWAMRGSWFDRGQGNNVSKFFNAPMPVEVLEKLHEAQERQLFSRFIVASADKSLFTELPAPLFVEPVLVGFITTDRRGLNLRQNDNIAETAGLNPKPYKINPGLEVRNGIGFLVAHWDLSKDLQFNTQS